MQVIFDHTEAEAADIKTFFFKPEEPMPYTAGQFIELTLAHKHADDRGEKRWFTLSSSPTDDFLTITTRHAAHDGSSFKKALFGLQPGDPLQMSEPMGDFVLPKLVQTPLIFVAGGIGITPFHSMLRWLGTKHESRPIKMLYAVRTEDDIIFQETFEQANQHVTIMVSEPSPAWGGERGRLTAEKILGLEKPTDDTLVYVSGPEAMVETLEKDLADQGLKKSQFIGDFFPNYPNY